MLIINEADLQQGDAKKYLPFLVAEVDEKFLGRQDVVAAEARIDDELIGFALAKIEENHAELTSIMVAEKHRRQGIGKALLTEMQNILAKAGSGIFLFNFDKSTPSGEALTKMITSLGWIAPTLHVIRYHFDAYAFDPDWIHQLDPLPPEIHIFPWKKKSVQDSFWIDYLRDQGRFHPSVNPDSNAAKIDYPTSVGMRHNDTLIGWSITHRTKPDTIKYSSLFIDHFFTHTGYGIRLLIESIRRHKELPVPRAIFEINIQSIDRTWGLFIKKRLLPLADKIEKIYQAIRNL